MPTSVPNRQGLVYFDFELEISGGIALQFELLSGAERVGLGRGDTPAHARGRGNGELVGIASLLAR